LGEIRRQELEERKLTLERVEALLDEARDWQGSVDDWSPDPITEVVRVEQTASQRRKTSGLSIRRGSESSAVSAAVVAGPACDGSS
jgi:hypothetical protein